MFSGRAWLALTSRTIRLLPAQPRRLCSRPLLHSLARLQAGRETRTHFHISAPYWAVEPVLLADIGEGIVECEIIQWFVEPGATVEEFSPLCEVQSDKASVEITSRFAGVVRRLYYEPGEMAKVGKPFVDIDLQSDSESTAPIPTVEEDAEGTFAPVPAAATIQPDSFGPPNSPRAAPSLSAALSTPAVRHLCRELKVDISHVTGTGKAGRVFKEDVIEYARVRDLGLSTQPILPPPIPAAVAVVEGETVLPLTNSQLYMFKTMTRSLTIPHFLYADEIDFTSLCALRSRLNKVLKDEVVKDPTGKAAVVSKLTFLPFIIKAVSTALHRFPILNARVDVDPTASRPTVVLRSRHNIGVAMDTPTGLLVPVVRDVGDRSVLSIAAELMRLHERAMVGRLTPADLAGGTITVSNIGNIGGTYLSPVIVEREVAILGIGRMRVIPAFADDGTDRVVRKHVCNFSWSADHRVVDGATLARASDVVRAVVEEPDVMVMRLR